jgi:hypothetical protein
MSKKKSAEPKKPPDLYLKVRSHPAGHDTVYLIHRDGAADAGLMYGEVYRGLAEMIAEVTGLRIEREESKFASLGPMVVPGCVSVKEQRSLFE